MIFLLQPFIDNYYWQLLVGAIVAGVLIGAAIVFFASSAAIATTAFTLFIGAAVGGIVLGGIAHAVLSIFGSPSGHQANHQSVVRINKVEVQDDGPPRISIQHRDDTEQVFYGWVDLTTYIGTDSSASVECASGIESILCLRIRDICASYGVLCVVNPVVTKNGE